MRRSGPPLLAILRSPLQGELLARVYLRTWDAGSTISDLAREVEAPIQTVQREVARLVEAGLLEETAVGRAKWITKPHDNDLVVRPLTELLAVTYGPLPVLSELLDDVEGIDEAYIYGSWAARYSGEPGPVPNDVDVVVVGEAPTGLLDEIAEAGERRLAREINIRRVRRARWRDPGDDAFIASVKARPLVPLVEPSRSEP